MLLRDRVTSWAAPSAATEHFSAHCHDSLRKLIFELFAVQDELVEEVELLGFGLLANVVLLNVCLYKELHLRWLKLEAVLLHLICDGLLFVRIRRHCLRFGSLESWGERGQSHLIL